MLDGAALLKRVFLCPLEYSLTKKVRCVIAKTKPQYQSDKKKQIKRGNFVIQQVFTLKEIRFTSWREALNQLFIFRITHRDNFIFCFFEKKSVFY